MAVGMKEVEDRSVSIRRLDRQGSESQTLDEAIGSLRAEATPPDLRRA
jgi:threonyl-tRNA synthetase